MKKSKIDKPNLKLKVAYDDKGNIYDFKAMKQKKVIKIGKISKTNKIIKIKN